jgi:uncharacterized protein
MTAMLGVCLAAAFCGSGHCAAMCGPVAALASSPTRALDRRGSGVGMLCYQSARLASYVMLGSVCGAAGGLVNITAEAAAGPLQSAAMLAGATMIAIAAFQVTVQLGLQPRWAEPLQRAWVGWIPRLLQPACRRTGAGRGALLGGLTPLLPCGWLYSFALAAVGTGSVLNGAMVMGALWAGSMPALMVIGWGAGCMQRRLGRLAGAMATLAVALAGAALIVHRTGPGAVLKVVAATAQADSRQALERLATAEAKACCDAP